jgi:hypothetical protein
LTLADGKANCSENKTGEDSMAAALEAFIIVAIGFASIAFFAWTLITGAGATAPLHTVGALVVFIAAWGYGLMRAY